jgi:hypothetical protein
LVWKHTTSGIYRLGGDNETEEWVDVEEIVDQEDYDTAELDPVFNPYVERIRSHSPDDVRKLKMMYKVNILFTSWSTKLFRLVPLSSWTVKYLNIDTDALYYLLGEKTSLNIEHAAFGCRQQQYWQYTLRSPMGCFQNKLTKATKCSNFCLIGIE